MKFKWKKFFSLRAIRVAHREYQVGGEMVLLRLTFGI